MAWTTVGNIQGPQGEQGIEGPAGPEGPQGIQGDPGPRGMKWFVGDGTPTTIVGSQIDDWYLDNLTGDIYELS